VARVAPEKPVNLTGLPHPHIRSTMKVMVMRKAECAVCGAVYDASHGRKYCSRECTKWLHRKRAVWEFVGPPEAPVGHVLTCLVCNKEFRKSRTGRVKSCSKACNDKTRKRRHNCIDCGKAYYYQGYKPGRCSVCAKAKKPKPKHSKVRFSGCAICKRSYVVHARRRKPYCQTCETVKHYPEHILRQLAAGTYASRSCVVCGNKFSPVPGKSTTTVCGEQCTATSIRRSKNNRNKARYAKKRGASTVHVVDYTRVFERDNWRCQICHIETPERLRGSIAGNAPEADHIVPLAAGGDHDMDNLQCLCRSCNGEKGAALPYSRRIESPLKTMG